MYSSQPGSLLALVKTLTFCISWPEGVWYGYKYLHIKL